MIYKCYKIKIERIVNNINDNNICNNIIKNDKRDNIY